MGDPLEAEVVDEDDDFDFTDKFEELDSAFNKLEDEIFEEDVRVAPQRRKEVRRVYSDDDDEPEREVVRQHVAIHSSNSGKAIASMVLGILGFFLFGVIFGILAIVLGFKAHRDISRYPDHLTGGGMATAGIVMGFIGVLSNFF